MRHIYVLGPVVLIIFMLIAFGEGHSAGWAARSVSCEKGAVVVVQEQNSVTCIYDSRSTYGQKLVSEKRRMM